MPSEAFALLAGFFLASATTFSSVALRTTNTLTMLFFSVILNAGILWMLTLPRGILATFATWSIVPYVIAGLFVPFVARIFFFEGIRRLGPSRTSFLSSSQPLIATLLAVIFLSEAPSPITLLGTACIIGGIILLSRQEQATVAARTWKPYEVIFPLIAALMFASRDAIVRGGMNALNDPYVAATTAASTSALCLMSYMTMRRRWRNLIINRSNIVPLLMSGVCAGFFYFFLFNALSIGKVSIVNPLVASAPIFVLILSYLFLRKHEPITRGLVLGGLLMMAGGFLIAAL